MEVVTFIVTEQSQLQVKVCADALVMMLGKYPTAQWWNLMRVQMLMGFLASIRVGGNSRAALIHSQRSCPTPRRMLLNHTEAGKKGQQGHQRQPNTIVAFDLHCYSSPRHWSSNRVCRIFNTEPSRELQSIKENVGPDHCKKMLRKLVREEKRTMGAGWGAGPEQMQPPLNHV